MKQTVHIPTDTTDLVADLKRGLSEVRKAHSLQLSRRGTNVATDAGDGHAFVSPALHRGHWLAQELGYCWPSLQ